MVRTDLHRAHKCAGQMWSEMDRVKVWRVDGAGGPLFATSCWDQLIITEGHSFEVTQVGVSSALCSLCTMVRLFSTTLVCLL